MLIDERSIPHSHPVLTIHTRHLHQDDELLSTYVHEQLHWFFVGHQAAADEAEQELMKMYPDVPVGYPDGADSRESVYLHLLVCRMEQRGDEALMGTARTDKVMKFWAEDHYRWIYRTVLRDGARIDAVLRDHHLDDPHGSQ